jgi:hypothetical protein
MLWGRWVPVAPAPSFLLLPVIFAQDISHRTLFFLHLVFGVNHALRGFKQCTMYCGLTRALDAANLIYADFGVVLERWRVGTAVRGFVRISHFRTR